MKQFRVVVVGGRKFNDYPLFVRKLDLLLENIKLTHEIHIVLGHTNGVDKMGERYAKERGYVIDPFPADRKNLDVYMNIGDHMEVGNITAAVIKFGSIGLIYNTAPYQTCVDFFKQYD